MKQIIIILLFAAILTSCATRQYTEVQENLPTNSARPRSETTVSNWPDVMKAGFRACDDKLNKGEVTTAAAYHNCRNEIILRVEEEANYPYMDLVKSFTKKIASLARKLDRKKITADEFNSQSNAVWMQWISEDKKRSAVKASTLSTPVATTNPAPSSQTCMQRMAQLIVSQGGSETTQGYALQYAQDYCLKEEQSEQIQLQNQLMRQQLNNGGE